MDSGGGGAQRRIHDEVVGVVWPRMLRTPLDNFDAVDNFVMGESGRPMGGIEFRINHISGEDPPELRVADPAAYVIGHIHASAVRGINKRVLAVIHPQRSPQARYASKQVAVGMFAGLSGGHKTRVTHASAESGPMAYKTLDEVSVCRRGKRPGSVVEEFFPSRHTLESLSDADRRTFAARFGYAAPRADVTAPDGVGFVCDTARTHYIDALEHVVELRRARVRAAERFDTAAATMSATSDASPPAPVAENSPTGTTTTAASATAAGADAPAATAGVPLEGNASLRDARVMAQELVQEKQRSADVHAKMAAMAERLAAMDAKEQAAAAVAAAAADKQRLADTEEVRRVFEAFKQHSDMRADKLAAFSEQYERQIAADPVAALQTLQPMLEIATRASVSEAKLDALSRRRLDDAVARDDDRVCTGLANTLTALDANIAKSTRAYESAMANVGAKRSIPAAVEPPAKRAATATTQQPVVAEPHTMNRNAPPPPPVVELDTRASANAAGAAGAAPTCRSSYQALMAAYPDRVPVYGDVAMGAQRVETHDTRMSADGKTQEPIVRLEQMHEAPVDFGLKDWNPEAYSRLAQMVRGRATGPRLRMPLAPL